MGVFTRKTVPAAAPTGLTAEQRAAALGLTRSAKAAATRARAARAAGDEAGARREFGRADALSDRLGEYTR